MHSTLKKLGKNIFEAWHFQSYTYAPAKYYAEFTL